MTLRVASWNMKVGRDKELVMDQLAQLMADHEPDVVCLQEAKTYMGAVRDRFGTGHGGAWYVYAHDDWPEANNCPVLVRAKGREKHERGSGWNTLRTTKEWVGPQGGVHQGRTWTHAKVDGVRVLSLHRCTNGAGDNAPAFKEEGSKLRGWINDSSVPVLVIGDHNCGVNATHAGASKLVAQDTGSYLCKDAEEPGIDYAIRHALGGKLKRGKAYGSDHGCVVFTEG